MTKTCLKQTYSKNFAKHPFTITLKNNEKTQNITPVNDAIWIIETNYEYYIITRKPN